MSDYSIGDPGVESWDQFIRKNDPLNSDGFFERQWTTEEREIADEVVKLSGAFGLGAAGLQMGACLGVRLLREREAALAAATGTAKTPTAAECEASQSGPKGNAQTQTDEVLVSIEPSTAQTLLDWNVLHVTDAGWTIDLDIWRTRKLSAADRLSSLEEEKRVLREALTTVCARATEFRAQAERAGRPSQAQWRGIEQVASTALSAGVGPLHTPMMENR